MIDGNLALQPHTPFNPPNCPLSDPLMINGWNRDSIGKYRSNGQIKDIDGFVLYTRTRNLKVFVDDCKKKSSSNHLQNPSKTVISGAGSSSPMGNPSAKLTPSIPSSNPGPPVCVDASLPALSSFSEYPSLVAARKEKPCLLIGYDSEWENVDTSREMLSWQFAFVDGTELKEFVFLKDGDRNLPFLDALGCILDKIGKYTPIDVRVIRRYKYCAELDSNGQPIETVTDNSGEARLFCKYVYRPEIGFTNELIQHMPDKFVDRSERDWSYFTTFLDYSSVESIRICLVCHAGKVDLSALEYGRKKLLRYLTDVQGGLTSLKPVKYAVKSLKKVNNSHVYPVSLSIADTMCHAPVGKKKLKDLGEALGIEKVDIDSAQKSQMKDLLNNDICLFMEYASTDSIVTVLYSSALYGYNNTPPVTVTSAAATVMKEVMMKYLNCSSNDEFNRVYRGLGRVNHGKYRIPDRPGFIEATSLEAISNDANTVQHFSSQAYHGGYNTCCEIGYFPFETFDYDLQNAYPTAMCLVPDINWENPIRSEITREYMDLSMFAGVGGINPITPFVGYVRFEFPDSCKFPCIPINVDGIPTYPLTSEGMDGVYVAGPFVWLALKLGAKVFCDRGYFLNLLYINDYSKESRSLAVAVKQLVVDRNHAKKEKGKGSLEELILKTMVNSGYGKTAQNVIQKSSWTAFKDVMEDLGCSSITNPVSAMMITSIVQVELLAAQNQIHDLGYMSCSVTTDGFISNCPEDTLKSLDLFGLRKYMEAARLFLTDGDPELWEVKHRQDDLVNFTTRGNVSLRCKERDGYDGVCAHNSTKSGFESDSYEDRLWLMTKVLSRTGTIDYTENEWTSFKDLVQEKPFLVKPITRHIRMDYDLKRKPIRSSFRTDRVIVDGNEYSIAHFDTEPYKNIAEFKLYRNKKKLTNVLRTEADWDIFWLKLDLNSSGAQPRDLEWSILNSCIMGHRLGRWDIPGLDGKTVDEKCNWINLYNSSGKSFKPSDWKNARRPERQANMLPHEMLVSKLTELGAVEKTDNEE